MNEPLVIRSLPSPATTAPRLRTRCALVLSVLLLACSPAFAGDVWDGAVIAATSLASGPYDRGGPYDREGPGVAVPATAGSWFGEGVGIALGIPVGVVSFPVWLGIAAASEKFAVHQVLQLSLLTGGSVYEACAAAGYHAVGAPLAGMKKMSGASRVASGGVASPDDSGTRLPPSKLRH